jgi:hypothetical protein
MVKTNASIIVTAIVGLLAIGVGLSFLLAWPVMALWNSCLVPAIHGLNEIGWLQAWGIACLCSILFKSHITMKE